MKAYFVDVYTHTRFLSFEAMLLVRNARDVTGDSLGNVLLLLLLQMHTCSL